MSHIEYEKAKKLGEKADKAAAAAGKSPNLPVLDEILAGVEIRGEVNLGLVTIPLDRVVGTATAGRASSFACNFMPLLELETEFAQKWSFLCDAHMEEGIHDPIKVFEYLNYYYVVEGNKRVSVLKFFDAVSVPAIVTRKIPKKTDDHTIRIYYEFMDFNRKTGVNFIWFSKEGNFQKLLEETGTDPRAPELTWDTAQVQNLTSAYYRFSKQYEEKGGKKLENITTGDAFLALVMLQGYKEVLDMTDAELKDSIGKMWEEFLMLNQGEDQEVTVALDPPVAKKPLLTRVLGKEPTEAKPLNIAFIYDRDPSTSDWLYAHELGRNHLKEVFGTKIATLKVTTADSEDKAVEVMEDLILNEGTKVIFTTTSQQIDASLKIAVKYPKVKVLNCSLNTSHRYIRTYYARLYEAKFLSGMLAGILTETGKIGYLADYPIYGTIANINAFAMGARTVNPEVKLYLRWTSQEENREAIYHLMFNDGVDYISDQDMITPRHASRKFGMYKLTGDQPVNLAMPVVNWGILYERILRLIMDGTWEKTDIPSDDKAINYWWGISAGVIDVILSQKLPSYTVRLIELLKQDIVDEHFTVFSGEMYSQDGILRCEKDGTLSAEEVMKMDWLLDNVVGEIPVADSLKEKARTIVELKGVRKNEIEDSGNS